jgi:hypothetical protein
MAEPSRHPGQPERERLHHATVCETRAYPMAVAAQEGDTRVDANSTSGSTVDYNDVYLAACWHCRGTGAVA